MAGIGFRLQKLLSSESYTDLVKAYLFSAVISTGPMLVVMIMLLVVQQMGLAWMSPEESDYLVGLTVYCFAFSMVGTGGILYIVTRYLADHYFLKNFEVFSPTYCSAMEIIFLLQSIPALFFLYPAPLLWHEKGMVFLLYLLINGIWLAMIFLSAAKDYFWIVKAYLFGGVGGILAAWVLVKFSGFAGVLAGFTLGQGIIFGILTWRIFMEFGWPHRGWSKKTNFDFVFYLKKHPYLFGVGMLLNVGIWVDKFWMWGSKLGHEVGRYLYVAPDYDTPIFLAFLAVVPSMAFYLIQMETSFAKCYVRYFKSIQNREDWSHLLRNKEAILNVLTKNFQKFVIFQGILSGVVILFITDISDLMELNPFQLGILRIGLLATFLQIGFLMFLNIFFYFDFQKEAFWIVSLFCLSNAALTYGTLQIGLKAYGFGFAGACFLALLASFLVLDHRLKQLDYYTFMKQPILIPKFGLERDK